MLGSQKLVLDEQNRALAEKVEEELVTEHAKTFDFIESHHSFNHENALIEKEWEELKKQRKALDEERAQFTDAAIKLGLERASLQVNLIVYLYLERKKGS